MQSVELGDSRKHYINGYPSLAAFIARDPDKSTAIYRRFDRLSTRNLLYLQSELVELEARQDEYDAADLKDYDMEAKQCARSWTDFAQMAMQRDREKARMELAMKIRKTMKEYRAALMAEHAVLNLRSPNSRTLVALRNWFHELDRDEDHRAPKLGGNSANILRDDHDLVSLQTPPEQDRLTKFVQNHLGILFQVGSTDGQTAYISERSISTVVAVISTVLAAGLLIGAVVSLYIVQSPDARLGMIAGFTCAFSISMALITKARRAEIFGATAAYTAVLVVFVSGSLGSTNPVSP